MSTRLTSYQAKRKLDKVRANCEPPMPPASRATLWALLQQCDHLAATCRELAGTDYRITVIVHGNALFED